jgi:S1-C subfamily serine protease
MPPVHPFCARLRAGSQAFGSVALAALVSLTTYDAALAQDSGSAARIYQELTTSIVRIETQNGASIFSSPAAGSGVVTGDGDLIVTADHVVAGAHRIWVAGDGGGKQRADIVKRDPHNDLALIRVPTPVSARPMDFSTISPPAPGQCVFALGNIMNWGIGIFQGIVTLTWCTDCPSGTPNRILTDITSPPGLSGGALVDCATGSLIGIVSFGIVALDSRALTAGIIGAVPTSEVAQLLREQVACGSGRSC